MLLRGSPERQPALLSLRRDRTGAVSHAGGAGRGVSRGAIRPGCVSKCAAPPGCAWRAWRARPVPPSCIRRSLQHLRLPTLRVPDLLLSRRRGPDRVSFQGASRRNRGDRTAAGRFVGAVLPSRSASSPAGAGPGGPHPLSDRAERPRARGGHGISREGPADGERRKSPVDPDTTPRHPNSLGLATPARLVCRASHAPRDSARSGFEASPQRGA